MKFVATSHFVPITVPGKTIIRMEENEIYCNFSLTVPGKTLNVVMI